MDILAEIGPAGQAAAQSTSRGEADYGRSIRAAARGLLTGVFDEDQFVVAMWGIVNRGLTNAFVEGMEQAGATREALDTPDFLPERLELDKLINGNWESLFNFSAFIIQQRDANYLQGQKQVALNHVMNRALLWSNQYDKARVTARTMVSRDAPMTWVLSTTTKEHCHSCLTFDGRTYRASTWAKYDALPRSYRLCCKGFRCGCDLVPAMPGTRITPGRFPEKALCN